MKNLALFLVFPLLSTACGQDETGYDAALLEQYRNAVPKRSTLSAATPENKSGRAVGDPAMYPHEAGPLAIGINGAVGGIISLMEQIVSLEPTLYNAETQEFIWGPWPNDNDFGTVLAYIRKMPEGEDFQYVYALLRGVDNNVAAMSPVIWGGATPDPEDEEDGVGVTLWDFEANEAFAEANDPDYATKAFDRGRFVAIYAAGPSEDNPDDRMTWVVSVFRDWVPEHQAGGEPIDLDYLYGKFEDASESLTLDFFDFAITADIHEPADNMPLQEDVSIRMAFLNGGWGRAEANAVGGELGDGEYVDVVECWDEALARQYVNFDFVLDGGKGSYTEPDQGLPGLCVIPDGQGNMVPFFASSLDELGIPRLADIDADLMAALEDVALHGVPE